MKLRRQDSLLLIGASLVAGIVTDVLVRQEIFGINFVLWALLWLIIGIVGAGYKHKLSMRTGVYGLLIAINGVLVYIRSEPIVQFWSVMIVLVCLTLLYTSVLVDNYSALSLFNRVLEFVGGYVTSVIRAVQNVVVSMSSRHENRSAKKLSVGVIVAVPLVLVFIGLFSSSDKVFSNSFSWIGDALSSLGSWLEQFNIGRGIVVTFWSAVSFGGIAMLLRTGYASRLSAVKMPKTLSVRDSQIITASVATVFALFIAIQVKYLFSGGRLPDGISYADYARRGYGELLLVTMLASAIVYIVHTSSKAEDKIGHWLKIGLLGLNALVVVSAWKRLSLYESAYGWTMTRFVARMGLVCIFIGILTLLVWLVGKMNSKRLFASNWYVLACVLTVSAAMNPIGLITTRNIVDRNSREVALDTNHIIRQSADSLPAICAHAKLLKAQYLDEYAVLADRKEIYTTSDGGQIITQDYPTQNAVRQTNNGLAAHYTKSTQYLDKYLYCLQK